jgi:hypothetical protein
MKQLFSGKNENLKNIVQNISNKIQTKIDKGELDQSQLVQEAGGLINNLESMKDQIPGFSEMVSNMTGGVSGMAGMMASMAATEGGDSGETSDDPMEYANMINNLLGDMKKPNNNVKTLQIVDKKKKKKRN